MKKLNYYSVALSMLLSSFFSIQVMAQGQGVNVSISTSEQTIFNLERRIEIERDTQEEEIKLEVEEGTKRLELMIESFIEGGMLTIEVWNPKGKQRYAHFTIGTQTKSARREMANGNIRKSLANPEEGVWLIKIKPVNAKGEIHIQSAISE